MSRQNSIKKVLLNAESLKKEVVGCDINSWMETNHKKHAIPGAKMKVKQVNAQPMATKKLVTINDEIERNNSYQMLKFVQKQQPLKIQQKKQNLVETKVSKNTPSELYMPNKENGDNNRRINGDLSRVLEKSKWKSSNSGYILAQMRRQFRQKAKLKVFQSNTNSLTQRAKDPLHQQSAQSSLSYYQHRYKKLQNANSVIYRRPLRS